MDFLTFLDEELRSEIFKLKTVWDFNFYRGRTGDTDQYIDFCLVPISPIPLSEFMVIRIRNVIS